MELTDKIRRVYLPMRIMIERLYILEKCMLRAGNLGK